MHHDPVWMRGLLALHIAAGFAAFVLAPIALITAKGGRAHKRFGIVYLWAMGIVAATAVPMALYRPVLFLALVAVFSFYAAFSGWRVVKLKALARGGSAEAVDWMAAGITFLSSLALALLGALRPVAVQGMGIVSIVFGILGMRLAYSQLRKFVRKPREKMFWWYDHLGNMIGSYIAAWTAFSVTTLVRVFPNAGMWMWLWPTMAGVPAITLTIIYYKRKFMPRKPPVAATA